MLLHAMLPVETHEYPVRHGCYDHHRRSRLSVMDRSLMGRICPTVNCSIRRFEFLDESKNSALLQHTSTRPRSPDCAVSGNKQGKSSANCLRLRSAVVFALGSSSASCDVIR